jgi:DNA-binding winged helix-turn-helix (wHTH) protein
VGIRFGPFTLDLDRQQLTRDGHAVHLTRKAFELLTILIRERPKALSKTVLQQQLWPDTFVAEANLSNLVAELRKALSEPRRDPVWIRTVHGFGYAFQAEPGMALRGSTTTGRPACWLEWGRRRFRLSPGEHVIGRDEGAEIRLDASTVSRRHARVVVSHEGAWLEDFNSKNGTLRGDEPVTAPVKLTDGDVIHVGSLRLTFHVIAPVVSTDTQVGSSS